MTRSVRLFAVLGAVIVLLGAGVFVGFRLLTDRVNDAIPQADLFGSATPTTANGTAGPSPAGSPTSQPGADIKGPLNILIVGVDTRASYPGWIPHADAVMIMHVNADLTKAYLTSLPRDLVVNVPAFAPTRFGGSRTKLTHAMSYGSKIPGKKTPDPKLGFQLVAKAVSGYTGITRFDAGALLTFGGMKKVVDAIGGIDMYIDMKVVSIHIRPDGKHRAPCGGCSHGYSGPQMVYNVGMRHMTGWQALDYSRQRYIPGGDYTRGRHQRQIIKAMVAKIFSTDIMTNATKLDSLLASLGSAVVFDGRGRKPTEFVYALRNLKANALTLVGLPGGGAYSGGRYIGENLSGIQASYFSALRQDKLDAFVKANPRLVNSTPS